MKSDLKAKIEFLKDRRKALTGVYRNVLCDQSIDSTGVAGRTEEAMTKNIRKLVDAKNDLKKLRKKKKVESEGVDNTISGLCEMIGLKVYTSVARQQDLHLSATGEAFRMDVSYDARERQMNYRLYHIQTDCCMGVKIEYGVTSNTKFARILFQEWEKHYVYTTSPTIYKFVLSQIKTPL